MENPFESGHIKNYILAYISVVVIMILFFIATTLFHENQTFDKKYFDTNNTKNSIQKVVEEKVKHLNIKLIDVNY